MNKTRWALIYTIIKSKYVQLRLCTNKCGKFLTYILHVKNPSSSLAKDTIQNQAVKQELLFIIPFSYVMCNISPN